jgi:hypothetical protein
MIGLQLVREQQKVGPYLAEPDHDTVLEHSEIFETIRPYHDLMNHKEFHFEQLWLDMQPLRQPSYESLQQPLAQ